MGTAHGLVHSCVRYLARLDSKSSSLDSVRASLGGYLRVRRGSIPARYPLYPPSSSGASEHLST